MVKTIKILIILIFITAGISRAIEVFSDRLFTDREGNIVAEGNVEAFYRGYLIKADRILYSPGEKTVRAFGNVYVKKEDEVFEVLGTEAFIDTRTGKGYYLDAEGKFREFYFSAKRVDKIDENTYYIMDGEVTTCPPKKKHLKVCFWKAAVTEKHVFAFSNRLKFFELPVAYSPLILFPVGERRSGLLPPMIGSNTYNTFIYRQPIYFAISMDKDATITIDYRDTQAKGIWFEYRQAFTLKEKLYMRAMYYKEPQPRGEWWTGREPETFRGDRYRIEMRTALRGWSLGLDIPSDPYFFEDVFFEQQLRATPFTLSYISYSNLGKDYLLTFTVRNYYDLTSPSNRETLNMLPEFNFYARPSKVGPFYINLTTTFTNFYRDQGLKANRLLFLPELELPLNTGLFMNYTRIRGINNFYMTNKSFKDQTVNTIYFENRTPLFLNFTGKSFSFLNTFEFVYTYSPNNFDNPQFDSYDVVVKENNLKGRLASSLSRGTKNVMSFFLEGGYNFLRSYRFPTDSVLIEKELLPLRAIISLYPLSWLTIRYDTTYDLNLDISASSISSLYLKKGKNFLSLSYATTRNSKDERIADQYTAGLSLDLKGFLIGGTGTYDSITDRILNSTAYIGYRGPCYFFKIDYRRTYYQNLQDYINEIFVVFNIFNLRDFKLPLRRR